MSRQVEMAKKFVALSEKLEIDESLFHPDYLQWELPNSLNPKGQKSDLVDSLKRMEVAKKIIAEQKFDITSVLEQNQTVVIEALWTGSLNSGQAMKAFFCMIFEFKDEKIYRIRNYDCFEK